MILKKKKMEVNGNWEGIIVYGKEYGENAGKKVVFRSELTQNNDCISGLFYDISGFGTNPEPADVNGKIEGNKIGFVKQYRTKHMVSGNKHQIDTSRKGPKIFYSGTFDEVTNSFNGNWTIKVSRKFFGLIPLNIRSTGTWTMKKI